MILLDHGAALFDHADYIIARLSTIAMSIGALVGIVMGIRARIQGMHAEQVVATMGTSAMPNHIKKSGAMEMMATAHPLLRASPARADKLIEKHVAKLKATRMPGQK